jgi:hypothetical protein
MSNSSKECNKRVQKLSCSQACTNPVNVCVKHASIHRTNFEDTELNQLTGIAAILTFPLDVEVVEAEERESREEERRQQEAETLDGGGVG